MGKGRPQNLSYVNSSCGINIRADIYMASQQATYYGFCFDLLLTASKLIHFILMNYSFSLSNLHARFEI